MQYIQGNPLGRGHSVSLLSFKSNSFRPIRQIWGFCSVALICFCCLARCLFCVDNAEVADLLQDGAFDVCTKILSVALMHWLLVLRIANPYINKRRCRGVGSSDNTDPPLQTQQAFATTQGNIRCVGFVFADWKSLYQAASVPWRRLVRQHRSAATGKPTFRYYYNVE